ncbi:MAG TPA: DUF2115 domain-containing protein [Methanospirillum sp.]|uniref:DUF2115 domain-containing protein n=1 Tax=Methanospirillum sp. TaxID=45200 RepID=UPI002CC96E91|nr:DUF2115 domain-containing protein [Methanospirillum sp.]HWQ63633.1 DUF2115 domain-containing protein [Methanospirillum sp.]
MDEDKDTAVTVEISEHLSRARTKRELGEILSIEITRYTLQDLQVIGGRLHTELIRLPRSYREQVGPYLTDQILGGYHRLLTYQRSGRFKTMSESIQDPETFNAFCKIIPIGCTQWDDTASRMPIPYTIKHRLFYYLIAAFTMFILEEPGHPVGMPFPGGFKVEDRDGVIYCLIRDKEKEVPHSLCNFCPAVQSEND